MQAFTGRNGLKDKDNTPHDPRIHPVKQGRSIHKLYSIVKEQTFFIAKSDNSRLLATQSLKLIKNKFANFNYNPLRPPFRAFGVLRDRPPPQGEALCSRNLSLPRGRVFGGPLAVVGGRFSV